MMVATKPRTFGGPPAVATCQTQAENVHRVTMAVYQFNAGRLWQKVFLGSDVAGAGSAWTPLDGAALSLLSLACVKLRN